MKHAFSVAAVGVLFAAAACDDGTLLGEPCSAEDPVKVCEGRQQLFCNGQIYELNAACSSECTEGAVDVVHEQETIAANTTWACEEGLHVVTGTVTVGPGATLTIAPGTLVKIDPSSFINVDEAGRVVVDATAQTPVLMTSNNGLAGGFGNSASGGLNVPGATGEPSVLRHLIVERGFHGIGLFGLSATKATPIVQNSTFRDNENFGIKLACDENDFAVPDFSADCAVPADDVPCGNQFFENKAGDVSACAGVDP